jgi:peptide/nickel transport system ATP-binding protein
VPILDVRGLDLSIAGTPILRGVDLAVGEGEIVGLVGASGSGKSLTALSIMRLLPPGSRLGGTVLLDTGSRTPVDLARLDEAALCDMRGRDVSLVFQEPGTALNPLKTIGEQVAEMFRQHRGASKREAAEEAAAILGQVGLPATRAEPGRYPHEISGGQRQRVVIAMALALRPKLVLADEPTTALDVTTQAQILRLLRRSTAGEGAGLLLVTHDLAVVAAMADRVLVLDGGRVVEEGTPARLLRHPTAPATRRLAEATRHVPRSPAVPHGPPLLVAEQVTRTHRLPRKTLFGPAGRLVAMDDVSFTIAEGESVGLVGESGSGKSTLSRAVAGLEVPQEGRITLGGVAAAELSARDLRAWRRRVQMVFQDPYGSFDPRHKAGRLVAEPLHLTPGLSAAERRRRTVEALEDVGLSASDAERYPHEFSGGQRQRLAIARALVTRPSLVVLDEPVSALDVVTRAQILDLLAGLRARHRLAYLFVSHDLAVVRAVTGRVLVMKDGRIVETGPTEEVLGAPRDPYTRALVEASLHLEAELERG